MKRLGNIDLMRIFLCLGVVTTHSLKYFGIQTSDVFNSANIFFLQANGVFYIISGYFNLEKEFNNSKDIINFYKNKFISIVFPFLAFVFVWAVWDYLHVNPSFDLLDFLSLFYRSLMNDYCDTHMWFLYPLFGLLLSTPFLSKALHHMDEKELKILWYVALGWNVVSYYLCNDFGISFRFLGWFLDGWLIYYIAGYYFRHVAYKESKVKWLVLGVLGYAFTMYGEFNIHPFVGSTDCQIMFTMFCMGVMTFWCRVILIKNERVTKILQFVAKNTFMIYLFHLRAMEYVVRKFPITSGSFGSGVFVAIASFLIALLLSIIANMCLKPIQKLIDRIWVVNE